MNDNPNLPVEVTIEEINKRRRMNITGGALIFFLFLAVTSLVQNDVFISFDTALSVLIGYVLNVTTLDPWVEETAGNSLVRKVFLNFLTFIVYTVVSAVAFFLILFAAQATGLWKPG